MDRNGKDLTFQFPEIVSTCLILQKNIEKQLPIFLDGELVILRTPYQANFSSIQTRGRTRSKVKIQQLSKQRPVSFLCFDLLLLNDQTLQSQTLLDRRKQLEQLFKQFTVEQRQLLLIHSFKKLNEIEEISFFHQAEGIVAKKYPFNLYRREKNETMDKMEKLSNCTRCNKWMESDK